MTSCFFCQNLLSDYIEKLLPKGRVTEIKSHIEECVKCRKNHDELVAVDKLLTKMPLKNVSHDFALRVVEASEGNERGRWASWKGVAIGASFLFVLLMGGAIVSFSPDTFPWLARFVPFATEEESFVRYYPLYHQAEGILDAQASMIEMRDAFSGSLWEEGGLSPEEFERVFQLKAAKEEEEIVK